MAQTQMGVPSLGFVNSLKSGADMGGNDSDLSNASNYVSISAMRARLIALNGTYYNTVRLDGMTVNDMVWALRSIDDRTTISDYMPVSTA